MGTSIFHDLNSGVTHYLSNHSTPRHITTLIALAYRICIVHSTSTQQSLTSTPSLRLLINMSNPSTPPPGTCDPRGIFLAEQGPSLMAWAPPGSRHSAYSSSLPPPNTSTQSYPHSESARTPTPSAGSQLPSDRTTAVLPNQPKMAGEYTGIMNPHHRKDGTQ